MENDLERVSGSKSNESAPASLKLLQQKFVEAVYGDVVPQDSAQELYRELTRCSIREVLNSTFEKTREVYESLGNEKSWDELCDEFMTQHRPTDFRINWAVSEFADWLPGEAWLKELADFEWVRFEVNQSRDPSEEDWLNPSLALRTYEYPVPTWCSESFKSDISSLVVKKFSSVVIFRDPKKFNIRVLELQLAALDLLSQWIEGESPEKSAKKIAQQLCVDFVTVQLQVRSLVENLIQQGVLLRDG
jgi:hypothetical protein